MMKLLILSIGLLMGAPLSLGNGDVTPEGNKTYEAWFDVREDDQMILTDLRIIPCPDDES